MTNPLPDGPDRLAARLDCYPIAAAWPAAARQRYLEWSAILLDAADLEITLGKGGISFYLPAGGRRIFAVHFNAMPRARVSGRGFADFRRDTLEPYLNPEGLLENLRGLLPPDSELRPGRRWCCLHFPWDRTADIARAITAALVLPLAGAVGSTA
ncbi:MAG TPA: hypothetical protein VD886_03890 [Herpetosiphonaceae bacterium]|nr:hypothetical protein [Herpetosiphonaceae bacterium]